jgi:hypothetical protein
MRTREYLWRSIAVFVAAIACFPVLVLLGYTLSGKGDRIIAVFLAWPLALLALGAYWVALTRNRIAEVQLPIAYQLLLYAALIGAAKAIMILPALITGHAPAVKMPAKEFADYVVDPLLPLIMLFLMIAFLAATPLSRTVKHDPRYSRWTLGITAYLILCLAPHFAWSFQSLWSGNPYTIQRIASLGMPPTMPAALALIALAIVLKRQSKQWSSARVEVDQVLV